MGRPDECARLTKEGKAPCEIAQALGISTGSVIQYLRTAIGFGILRCSDILIALDRKTAGELPSLVNSDPSVPTKNAVRALKAKGLVLEPAEVDYYLELVASRSFVADLYYYISEVELFLHEKIAIALKAEYGDSEGGWWKTGVPEKVRIDCSTVREKDPEDPTHAYFYATLTNLIDIIEKNWTLMTKVLFTRKGFEKQALLRDLRQMNTLRNRVMHPIRYGIPKSEDVEFVRGVCAKLIGPRPIKNRWGTIEVRMP